MTTKYLKNNFEKMSIKTLLGLDSFPLKDYELIQKLAEARSKNLSHLEFKTKKGRTVKINISSLYPEGIMHGSYRLYHKSKR